MFCVPAGFLLGQQSDTANQHSVGRSIKNTEIKDVNGTPQTIFADDADFTVVIFMGWECPLVKQYVPRLNDLQNKFADQGVRFLAVNSNQHDSLEELKYFARNFELEIPILKDVGNELADEFGAQRTPEAFLLDAEQNIIYQGRIDDQFTYGRQRDKPVQ
ncbi:MAG: redoxin domain-containing protein, partial [Pirellulaceae bacterium]|nr:redoxin domain-containing protein [Pirellulaceae bacterium]